MIQKLVSLIYHITQPTLISIVLQSYSTQLMQGFQNYACLQHYLSDQYQYQIRPYQCNIRTYFLTQTKRIAEKG